LLAHGRWFSPGTPASSTAKTGRHDIAEILLKVALNTINQSINQSNEAPTVFSSFVCGAHPPFITKFLRILSNNENFKIKSLSFVFFRL